MDHAGGLDVVDHLIEQGELALRPGEGRFEDRSAELALRLALLPADDHEGVGGDLASSATGTSSRLAQLGGGGPCGAMDRAVPPPAPDFFGDEGEERGEEPMQCRQRQAQRMMSRRRAFVAVLAVGAGLDQLHVVVGEPPEKGLGAFE